MYVNELTLGYGDRGAQAVQRLMTDAYDAGLIPQRITVEFAA
jgi:predicted solute-binding protein